MKVAVIAPTKLLDKFAARSNYHLVLAHQYMQDAAYRNFYKRMVARGDFVILDNSAYELKRSVDVSVLRECAEDLHPTAMFLPDARFDTSETLRLVAEAIPQLQGLNVKLLAVPQGRNLSEVLACYNILKAHPDIHGFGLYEEIGEVCGFKDRVEFLRFLDSEGLLDYTKYYHLLGMEEDVTKVRELCKFPWVSGIDSAKPVVYGLHDIKFSEVEVLPEYPHRPEGYFEIEKTPYESAVIHNIDTLKKWAQNYA